MWNKCESCNKQIETAEDCRLTTNDGKTIHTYCKSCYEAITKVKPKKANIS